jgi:hypothetical protein
MHPKARAQEVRLAGDSLHQRRPERHRVFDVSLEEGLQASAGRRYRIGLRFAACCVRLPSKEMPEIGTGLSKFVLQRHDRQNILRRLKPFYEWKSAGSDSLANSSRTFSKFLPALAAAGS